MLDMLEKFRELPGDVIDAAGKVLLAGLGTVTLAQERSAWLFDTLVQKGRSIAPDRTVAGTLKSVGNGALGSVGTMRDTFTDEVGALMHRANLPTESEIVLLTGKIEALGKAVEGLRIERERAVASSVPPTQAEVLALEPAPPPAKLEPRPEAAPPVIKAAVPRAGAAKAETKPGVKHEPKPHKH